jgi:hypothetical protein
LFSTETGFDKDVFAVPDGATASPLSALDRGDRRYGFSSV